MNRTNTKQNGGARQNGRKMNGTKPNGNGNGNGRANGNGNGRQTRVTQSIALSNQYNNVRTMNNNVRTERGSDFVNIVTVKGTPTRSERILVAQDISPSAFAGTRLTQLSQLYERYRFKSMNLRWVPAVPATLACQFILYVDTDPLDDPEDAATVEILIRQATAQTGSQQWNFNLAKRIPMALRRDDQLYYTGDTKLNPRFSLMGRAYLIQVTNPVNFNGEPITTDFEAGSLYIDWVCEFQTPQINPAGFYTGFSQLLAGERGNLQFNPFTPITITIPPDSQRRNKQFIYTVTQTQTNWVNSTSVTADGTLSIRQDDGDDVIQSNRIDVDFTASNDSWELSYATFAVGKFSPEGTATFIFAGAPTGPSGSGGSLALVFRTV